MSKTDFDQNMSSSTFASPPIRLSSAFLAIRPRTLPASLSPVILGSAMAAPEHFNVFLFVCACGVALFLQIAVNLANDLFDAKSGVDTDARLGPVRVTQSGLISQQNVIFGIALCIAIAVLCGLILVLHTSWLLLLVGLACILATLAYSGGPFPLASHSLGEITVLIFFGWVAIVGSYYVQTLGFNWQVFYLANALGLILAAIMLVNNLRDIPTDKIAGKITLAVRLGDSGSRLLYKTLLIFAVILHCLAFLFFPAESKYLVTFAPLAFSLPLGIQCWRDIQVCQARSLNPLLAKTALLGLLYAVSTAIFTWLDAWLSHH